jgi:hypothetical protein
MVMGNPSNHITGQKGLSIRDSGKANSKIIGMLYISLLIFLIPLSSSADFSLTSPNQITQGEEFTTSIVIGSQEIYDVKISIENEEGKALSKTLNNEIWKSSFYYIKFALPRQKDFKIIISDLSGETEICAKLRKPNSSPTEKICNKIEILPSTSSTTQEQTSQNSETQEEPFNQEPVQEIPETQKSEQKTSLIEQDKTKGLSYSQPEKIILNSPKEESAKFTSKTEKTRLWIIYSFSLFTIIIIILLSLRKL